jgi:hypothetical protein
MGRPKLEEKEKKIKLGITISNHSFTMLEMLTNNKSEFIENLINNYLKNVTITNNVEIKYDENNNYVGSKTIKIIDIDGN